MEENNRRTAQEIRQEIADILGIPVRDDIENEYEHAISFQLDDYEKDRIAELRRELTETLEIQGERETSNVELSDEERLQTRIEAYESGSTYEDELRVTENREKIIKILDEHGIKDANGNLRVVPGEGGMVEEAYKAEVEAMRKEIRELAARRTGKVSQRGEDVLPTLRKLKEFLGTPEGRKEGAYAQEVTRLIEENKKRLEAIKTYNRDYSRVDELKKEIENIQAEIARIESEVEKNPNFDAESIQRTRLRVTLYHRQNELRGILVRNPKANEKIDTARATEKIENIISELQGIQKEKGIEHNETPAITPTVTETGVETPTITPTVTETGMETPTISPTVTETGIETPTITPTVTEIGVETPTITPTVTETGAETPTITLTVTETGVETPTITTTVTETGVETPTITPTVTETGVETPTITPTVTIEGEPTYTVGKVRGFFLFLVQKMLSKVKPNGFLGKFLGGVESGLLIGAKKNAPKLTTVPETSKPNSEVTPTEEELEENSLELADSEWAKQQVMGMDKAGKDSLINLIIANEYKRVLRDREGVSDDALQKYVEEQEIPQVEGADAFSNIFYYNVVQGVLERAEKEKIPLEKGGKDRPISDIFADLDLRYRTTKVSKEAAKGNSTKSGTSKTTHKKPKEEGQEL